MSQKRIYFLGALVLLITAIFSKGYYNHDEQSQILELAGLKLGITPVSATSWQYDFKIRPALQPFIVFAIYRFYNLISTPDPFVIATLTRILSAALSFLAMVFFIKTFQPQIKEQRFKQMLLWLSFFLWFIVYNDVRFSSENWSGNFFLIALCLLLSGNYLKTSRVLLAGFLLGISFLLRFQSAFLIIGLVSWLTFIKKENYTRLAGLALSIFAAVALGAVIDHWFYGEWTLSCWNYFYQNIIMHKAAAYGVSPWWYYFSELTVNAVPPFSIIYPVAFLLFFFFYPKHILTFIALPFLLVHFIVGHKELRFIFPIEYFFPFMAVMVYEVVLTRNLLSVAGLKFIKFFEWGFWISNIALLLVIMFKPADSQVNFYQKLYDNYPNPTLLYYNTDESPYGKDVPIYFYRRPNLEIEHINSVNEIKPVAGKTILFAGYESQKNNSAWQLIYRSLPDWLLKYDFNHWQERSKIWYVYEVR